MSLLKQKVTGDTKSSKKPGTTRPAPPELNEHSNKKSQLSKMGETPKKQPSGSKGNYSGWSGKKRLAVVRDEHNAATDNNMPTDGQLQGPNQDSNSDNRSQNDHFKEYGFADLIAKHKSTHGQTISRGNPEYFFKRNDKDHQAHRLGSPEIYTARHKKSAYEVSQHVIRRVSVEDAAKENSVNKHNVQSKPSQEEMGTLRSISTISKRIESMSTIQPNANDNVDTRLGATIKIIGASSNQITTISNRPLAFDIRSSTTLTRQIINNPDHAAQKQKQTYPVREIKRTTSPNVLKTAPATQPTQHTLNTETTEAKSFCTKAEHSAFGQLESEHSQLKQKFTRYERILSEKQKDIGKLELENHNIKIQMKNCQAKILSLQDQKLKIVNYHANAEHCMEELRKQTQQLKKQIMALKSKHGQDLAKAEKEVRDQYGQLLHDKNNQIAKLNSVIREREADVNAAKQDLSKHFSEMDKAGNRISQLQKFVDYYKKENKVMGVELFNVKKRMESEAKQKTDSETKLNQTTLKLQYLSSKIAELERILKGKDGQMAEKLKQSQHQKNLLYDSMSNTTRLKEMQIMNLRRELSGAKQDSIQRQPTQNTTGNDQNKLLIESLRRELEQTTNDLKVSKSNLIKQVNEKQRLMFEKKQLTAALQQRQKRQDEQKIKMYQSQSLKSFDTAPNKPPTARTTDLEKLMQQLTLKNVQIANLGKTVKSLQQRYAAQESLLNSTSEELFTLRLHGLAKKLQSY